MVSETAASPVPNLLIRNATVVTMDADRRILRGASIAVAGDRIVDIGPDAELASRYGKGIRILDGSRHAVLPGLVDLHGHSMLTRGLSDGLDLTTFLLKLYPKTTMVSPGETKAAAYLAYCDAIRSGTTCMNDMYRHMLGAARAAEEVGIRVVLSSMVSDAMGGHDTVDDNLRLIEEKHGAANGRIRTSCGIEGVPGCSREELDRIREISEKHRVGIHVHLNETPADRELSKQRNGLGSAELLHVHGLFTDRTVVVHCVDMLDEEIEWIANGGSHVAHCPVSNAKCGMGISPIPEMQARGINVGLGHDAAACNNTRDLFETMRFAGLLHAARRKDPAVWSPMELLEMATLRGARALGLDDEIGSIEVGKKADLILIDTAHVGLAPHVHTEHNDNLVGNLVYAVRGADVTTSIIDGQVVMENRKVLTVDEADVIAEANRAAANLVSRLEKAWPAWSSAA